MCHIPNPGTLEASVLEQVQEFCDDRKTFSVYDVTVALRNKVNDNKLQIQEIANPNPNSPFKYLVNHDAVKNAFQALWVDSSLPRLNRNFNGRNFEYTLDDNSQPTIATVTTQVSSQPAVQPSVNPSTTDTELKRRFSVYINNCQKIGKRPTLKEVQSAVKRGDVSSGVSCKELDDYAQQLGYKVVKMSSNLSEAYVEV